LAKAIRLLSVVRYFSPANFSAVAATEPLGKIDLAPQSPKSSFTKNGQELLNQKEWASDVCRKEVVKILYCVIRNWCRLADSGVAHEHIQSIACD
jgi:hypothetical protein